MKPEESTTPTPEQPVQPANTELSPEAKKAKQSKLIALIVGGILLIVIAVIAIFFFVSQNTVSREDYQEASTQYDTVRDSGADLSRAVSSMSSRLNSTNDDTFKESAAKVDEEIATLTTETEKLGELKAMKVGEGKEVYEAFDNKLTGYIDRAKVLVQSVQDMRPAIQKCSNASKAPANDQRAKQIEECATEVNAVSEKIGNAELKAFTKTLGEQYGELADVYKEANEQAQAGGSDATQARELRAKLSEIQNDILRATTQLSREVRTADTNAGPENEANALRDFLKTKIEESK